MDETAFALMKKRQGADRATRSVARALRGTAESDPFSVADRLDLDFDEDALYAIVDVCGICGWWHDRVDLHDTEEGDNGLACAECDPRKALETGQQGVSHDE